MKIKKIFLISTCLALFSMQGFSESLGKQILKKSDLSFDFPFALTMGNIRNYSKACHGFELKFGTELMDLTSGKGTAGLCTTFFYRNYDFKREELQTFCLRGFSEGFWVEYNLPQKWLLRTEINVGLGITKAKATSIYEAEIDSNYNSFVFGINSAANRKFYESKTCALFGKCGLDLKILKEEGAAYSQLGLTAGIIFKAGKK